jgi:hypothetical protein
VAGAEVKKELYLLSPKAPPGRVTGPFHLLFTYKGHTKVFHKYMYITVLYTDYTKNILCNNVTASLLL